MLRNWWEIEMKPFLARLRRNWIAITAVIALLLALGGSWMIFNLSEKDGEKFTRAEAVNLFDRNRDGVLTRQADMPFDGIDGDDGTCDLSAMYASTVFCREVDACATDQREVPVVSKKKMKKKAKKPTRKKVTSRTKTTSLRKKPAMRTRRASRPVTPAQVTHLVTSFQKPSGGTHHVEEHLVVPAGITFRLTTETLVVKPQ